MFQAVVEAFAELYINAPEMSRDSAEGTQALHAPNRFALSSYEPAAGAMRVLLVGCNHELQREFQHRLGLRHWEFRVAASGAAALAYLQEQDCGLALVAPSLPDLDTGEFKQLVASRFPKLQVVDLEACQASGQAQTGLPGNWGPLASRLPSLSASAVEPTRAPTARSSATSEWEGMVGASAAMQRVFRTAALVARRDTTVLIVGESGTGKDLLARAIHNRSSRARQPFVVINCAAIPEALLEAELFGYAKGSFTGALQSRNGRVHAAHGGTLFLDEIGDMPLPLQSKILRFLEQGEVQRIGSTDTLKVDCRVIAATNVNLQGQIQARQFREDLYYRLAVLPIALPPLRERMEDLPALCAGFIARFCPDTTLHQEALDLLIQHRWPGNIRELRNVMERASVVVEGRRTILAEDILL